MRHEKVNEEPEKGTDNRIETTCQGPLAIGDERVASVLEMNDSSVSTVVATTVLGSICHHPRHAFESVNTEKAARYGK